VNLDRTLLVAVAIAALVAWRVFARIRRLMVRQRLTGARPWILVCVLPVALAALLLVSLPRPASALALVGGVAVGVGLGLYGLRLTTFEETPQGLFFTPNRYLGAAISLLLVGRIAYRALRVYVLSEPTGGMAPDFMRTPLTLLLVGTLAGYYLVYSAGLLRWRRRVAAISAPTI
jgi:hypothetical protein